MATMIAPALSDGDGVLLHQGAGQPATDNEGRARTVPAALTVPHPVTSLVRVSALEPDLVAIPERPGAYAFYADQGAALPGLLGAARPVSASGLSTLYVGKADDLRLRLKHQLRRDARVSQLKGNLGLVALDDFALAVRPIAGKRYFLFADEGPIDSWIVENVLLGFVETPDPIGTENAWLQDAPGLLNVSGRSPTLVTREISQRRAMASGLRIVPPHDLTHRHLRSARRPSGRR